MSWPTTWSATTWPVNQASTTVNTTAIVPNPVTNPVPTPGTIPVNPTQYTAEQWATMQQQNWQQWMQWQQQYQQWQQQYGEQYQKSMNALSLQTAVQTATPVVPPTILPQTLSTTPTAVQPPLPVAPITQPFVTQPPLPFQTTVAPPPPLPDTKPPPPPEQQQTATFNYSQPPPTINMQSLNFNKPPPIVNTSMYSKPPPPIVPNTGTQGDQTSKPPPSLLSLKVDKPAFDDPQTVQNKRKNSDESYESSPTQKNPRLSAGGTWNPENNQEKKDVTPIKKKSVNPNEITEAERKFDEQFKAWEEQFNKWKEQNANHPDKAQYKEYEAKWEAWRNQLLDRREQMRKKRMGLTTPKSASKITTSVPAPSEVVTITVEKPESKKSEPKITILEDRVVVPENYITEQSIQKFDVFNEPPKEQRKRRNRLLNDSTTSECSDLETSKSQDNLNTEDTTGNTSSFEFMSKNDGGIPGLDLVEKQDENKDVSHDKPKAPDYDAISRGINSILGDENLVNIISLVSQQKQGQVDNLSTSNISNTISTTNTDFNQSPKTTAMSQRPPYQQDPITPFTSIQNKPPSFDASREPPPFGMRAQGNLLFPNNPDFNRPPPLFDLKVPVGGQFGNNFGYDQNQKNQPLNLPQSGPPPQESRPIFDNKTQFQNQNDNRFPGRSNYSDGRRSPSQLQRQTPVDNFIQRDQRPNMLQETHSQDQDMFNQFTSPNNKNLDRAPFIGNKPPSLLDLNITKPPTTSPWIKNDNFNRFNDESSENFMNKEDMRSFNQDRDNNRPPLNQERDNMFNQERVGNRSMFNQDNRGNNRQLFNDDRDTRPLYGQDRDNNRPLFVQDRDGNRPLFGSDRDVNRPPFGQDRDDNKSQFDQDRDVNRPSFGQDRDGNRPLFGSDRDVNRPPFGQDRDGNRSSFGQDRDGNRPSFGQDREANRFPFGQDRDSNMPLFGSDRDNNRNSFGQDRDINRSLFNKDRDNNRPPFDQNRDFNRPSFNEDKGNIRPLFDDANRSVFPDEKDNFSSMLNQDRDGNRFNEGRNEIRPLLSQGNMRPMFDQGREIFNTDNRSMFNQDTIKPLEQNIPEILPFEDEKPRNLDDEILAPTTVIDYDHKSLYQDDDIIFIEPVITIDYNHKSKNIPLNDSTKSWRDRNSHHSYDIDRKHGSYDARSWRQSPYDYRGRDAVPRNRNLSPSPYPKRYDDYEMDKRFSNRRSHGSHENTRSSSPKERYDKERYDKERYDKERYEKERYEKKRYDKRHSENEDSNPTVTESLFPAAATREIQNEFGTKNFKDNVKNFGDNFKKFSKWDDPSENSPRHKNNAAKSTTEKEKNKSVKIIQNVTLIDDLLSPPGRNARPHRIVIILRGPPGSGKTFLAKLIKDKEVSQGGSAPRILSLDDYFMVEIEKDSTDPETGRKIKTKEMVYEYEQCMEIAYLSSLVKAFKKTISDGYFSFIIVDCVNDKVKQYEDMWSFAKQNGFQVYVCQMELDIASCTKRNIHGRTEEQIAELIDGWEHTPSHHLMLDATSLLQAACISEVEMDEVSDDDNIPEEAGLQTENDEEEAFDDEAIGYKSKWETMEHSFDKLARLDGINKPLRHSTQSMEDYLQLDDWKEPQSQPGQKRVRWADLVEKREQEKMRAIGFVVGQTDWNRMMDPSQGSNALTQTKFIESIRKY